MPLYSDQGRNCPTSIFGHTSQYYGIMLRLYENAENKNIQPAYIEQLKQTS